jgi:hypothetical protein
MCAVRTLQETRSVTDPSGGEVVVVVIVCEGASARGRRLALSCGARGEERRRGRAGAAPRVFAGAVPRLQRRHISLPLLA